MPNRPLAAYQGNMPCRWCRDTMFETEVLWFVYLYSWQVIFFGLLLEMTFTESVFKIQNIQIFPLPFVTFLSLVRVVHECSFTFLFFITTLFRLRLFISFWKYFYLMWNFSDYDCHLTPQSCLVGRSIIKSSSIKGRWFQALNMY